MLTPAPTMPTARHAVARAAVGARLRLTLLRTTGLLGVLLAGAGLCSLPAAAQDYTYPTVLPHGAAPASPPPARPGHVPGVGPSYPSSAQSSNISPYDTRSTIAPRLPTPAAGEDAAPRRFLIDARRALAAGRTGEAQEALERAETRLLDRSTPAFVTNEPSRRPLVGAIHEALRALSAGDRGRALSIVDVALARMGPPGRPGPGAGRPPYPTPYAPPPYGRQYAPPPYPYAPPPGD